MSLPPQGAPQSSQPPQPAWQPPMPQQPSQPAWQPPVQQQLPAHQQVAWQQAAAPRPPLTDTERRRLLRIGASSGALLGVGTALGGVILLFWAFIVGVSALVTPLVYLWSGVNPVADGIAEIVTPITVGVVAIGTVLCLLGLLLSWGQLRRWGAGRALGITAAAAAIATVPVHVVAVAVAIVTSLLEPEGDPATSFAIAALAAGFIGTVVGAMAGAGAWRWMGGALRPRDAARRA